MKKLLALLSAALIVLSMSACAKTDGNTRTDTDSSTEAVETTEKTDTTTESEQVANPNTTVDADTAAEELGLKKFKIDGSEPEEITRIEGDPAIFEVEVDGITVRISKAEGATADISGIYLSGKISSAISDSDDSSSSPSVTAEMDSDYAKAYCEYNGYFIAVSADAEDVTLDSITTLCQTYATDLV